MSRKKTIKDNSNITKVTWIGTAVIFLLLVLFLIVTLFSTNSLSSQIQTIMQHPYIVSTNMGDIKTNLALMRIRTERLQSYNQPEDVEFVRGALEDLYSDVDLLLEEVGELYLGPDEDTEALINTYKELKAAHDTFLDFAKLPTSTTDVIADYEEEHLYSIYDKFELDANRILDYVHNTQQNIFTSAGKMNHSVRVWSLLIFFVTTLGLVLYLGVIRKISGTLYQKNRQFDVLSDTIDETFLIFGEGTAKCDFVSGSAQKVLGIPAAILMEDSDTVYKYMSDETAQIVKREISLEPGSSWEKTIEYHNPNSLEPCWLQLQLYRTEGDDSRYIMTLTDRTEERRSNQALEDALASAQRANNAKKDFLSRMSHEIRTPMNAIIGMTTIAAACIEDTEKVESCLEKIGISSKHLLMLINDVLDMSRIESNRISINAEPFELYQFLNTFISVVYPQAADKGIDFTEKTSGFAEHTTYIGDTLRLNQILLNLLSNAIKFTPEGGKVHLEVTHLSDRGNKSWLRFVVSDTGIGMDEQGLERLYTPFEQADATIAGKYGGTGLGMSITQNLVSLMGGYITVKSKLGEGTTFSVELPFAQSNIDLQPLRETSLENLEVLVVDDERDICEHAVILLRKMKINAEWVLSGAEAISRVVAAQNEGNGFDVCFIDWKMPDMDGVETARRIRKMVGPDTPIIIISAYDWSDIEEEARAAGVNAFIAKPMFQSSIYNALVNVTNGNFGMANFRTVAGGHMLDGKRILIAEDNAMNMEIAVKLIEMNGATTESVENGQAVVSSLIQSPPGYYDAILMDVQMPVMDGCEATRQIRASGHADAETIPIIAITANAFEEDVASVLAAGMNAHICKPFDINELCVTLSREFDRAAEKHKD